MFMNCSYAVRSCAGFWACSLCATNNRQLDSSSCHSLWVRPRTQLFINRMKTAFKSWRGALRARGPEKARRHVKTSFPPISKQQTGKTKNIVERDAQRSSSHVLDKSLAKFRALEQLRAVHQTLKVVSHRLLLDGLVHGLSEGGERAVSKRTEKGMSQRYISLFSIWRGAR